MVSDGLRIGMTRRAWIDLVKKLNIIARPDPSFYDMDNDTEFNRGFDAGEESRCAQLEDMLKHYDLWEER